MKVIINLGRGNLLDGCHNVTVQLIDWGDRCLRQINGSLPPAPELGKLFHQWRMGYRAFYQEQAMRINLLQSEGTRYSELDFSQICQSVDIEFNRWLGSSDFALVERILRTELNRTQPIQIIINTVDLVLQQLPWHLWNFINDYPQAEIAFSALNWHKIERKKGTRSRVRILSILGDSEGIDLQEDLESLLALPQAEIVVLSEPRLAELNEYLWQSQGWDILLFSGHSFSDRNTGYIHLNATEKITITQLKNSLTKAIANGLQIAIFNSCEGMKLGMEIADLALPYGVVMSEPVPDKIAQLFLKYFVTALSTGSTFSQGVKEARLKLSGWETEYICASWLPKIWQNPAIKPLTWEDLTRTGVTGSLKLLKTAFFTSLVVSTAVMLGRSLSWLEPLEFWAYDRALQQRPAEVVDPRILVVEVTEADTNRDPYPLSDKTLLQALDILEQYQPAAIGLDIHRANPKDAAYSKLIESIETNPRLFPVCAYGARNNSYAPPQGLSSTKLNQQMGFSDLPVDEQTASNNFFFRASASKVETNPRVRRHLLSYDPSFATQSSQCLTPYSFSFQLAYEYLHQAGIEPLTVNSQEQWQFGNITFQEMGRRFGGYQQLSDRSSQIPLNYRAGQPAKRISLQQLLSGKIPQELIANRIVLIGYTASVARDYFNTPYGAMPGVWIHAHATSQMISAVLDDRPLIWVLPQGGEWLLVLGWSLVTGGVMTLLYKYSAVYSCLALGFLVVVIDRLYLLLSIQGGWLPYIPTTIAVIIVGAMAIFICYRHYNRDRNTRSLQNAS